MAEDTTLAAIAWRLHGLPVTEFTAARDTAAKELKASGDAALAGRVKNLRRPGAGAHLVNLLVRDDEPLLGEIGELGDRLRAAQAASDARRLRALDQERRAVVARAVRSARTIGGRDGRATDASLRDVEQTVWAAVIDAGAFATMRAGLLVRPLEPGGFGSVDLAGASAVPVPVDEVAVQRSRRAARKARPPAPDPTAASREAAEEKRKKKAEADRRARAEELQRAQHDLDAAQDDLRRADEAQGESAQAVDDVTNRLAGLQLELAELRERVASVEQAIRDEKTARTESTARLRAAQKTRRAGDAAVERARERVTELSDDR